VRDKNIYVEELKKLSRILLIELRYTLGGKFVIYVTLMFMPLIIAFYVSTLFWQPSTSQLVAVLSLLNPGADMFSLLRDTYIDMMKNLHPMVYGYWLGFPALIVTSIVVGDFLASERGSGTLEVIAAKPVHRLTFVMAKMIVFLSVSLGMIFLIYIGMAYIVNMNIFGGRYILRSLSDSLPIIYAYTAVTWIFTLAISSITLLFSIFTKKGYVASLGVIGYYIAINISSSILEAFVPGGISKTISQILSYIDVSSNSLVLLGEMLYGDISSLLIEVSQRDYTVSLISLMLFIIIPVIISMSYLERMDLT
jgi:ABC-type transport system involved in multi-copper enzyme maturation permease subunit